MAVHVSELRLCRLSIVLLTKTVLVREASHQKTTSLDDNARTFYLMM